MKSLQLLPLGHAHNTWGAQTSEPECPSFPWGPRRTGHGHPARDTATHPGVRPGGLQELDPSCQNTEASTVFQLFWKKETCFIRKWARKTSSEPADLFQYINVTFHLHPVNTFRVKALKVLTPICLHIYSYIHLIIHRSGHSWSCQVTVCGGVWRTWLTDVCYSSMSSSVVSLSRFREPVH